MQPFDDPLVRRARELARRAHDGHERKAGGPYFGHLEATARILADSGVTDPAQLAAAYLHDLLEDRPRFADALREQMPGEVVAMCEVLTEPKRDAEGELRPKRERFGDYVEQLCAGTEAARRAIPVSCADKVHNLQSLVEEEEAGKGLLLRLNTRPGEHREQLSILSDVYGPVVPSALRLRFDHARVALLDLIGRWLPGRAVMIAAEAHLGRFDADGAPAVDKSLRLRERALRDVDRVVAALHAVVPSGAWTLDALRREGFGEDVVVALDALAQREGEPYEAYIDRVSLNPLARRVKVLELEDALAPRARPAATAAALARAERHRAALARLR